MEKILITGAGGQLGTEITEALVDKWGAEHVVATDIKKDLSCPCEYKIVDVMDQDNLNLLFEKNQFSQIYHLAALLSARAEENPLNAWDINMKSQLNILDLSVKYGVRKVFWPSSIAAFGPGSPRINTPQNCVMDPTTVYGISKLAGERWMEYYFLKYGLDTRSIRYPGIISYKTPPGGGTTDYAVDVFFKVLQNQKFTCFLQDSTALPMMYIDDAIRATLELMDAPSEKISVRSSYNLAAVSFTPEELFSEIKKHINKVNFEFKPDFRQKIADSWPDSIDDTSARQDWKWNPHFGISEIAQTMLKNIPVFHRL